MTDNLLPIRCEGCGKFIGFNDCERSVCDFTPLNEFGPEVVEWTCRRCLEQSRAINASKPDLAKGGE